jgi:hypothetical protein
MGEDYSPGGFFAKIGANMVQPSAGKADDTRRDHVLVDAVQDFLARLFVEIHDDYILQLLQLCHLIW